MNDAARGQGSPLRVFDRKGRGYGLDSFQMHVFVRRDVGNRATLAETAVHLTSRLRCQAQLPTKSTRLSRAPINA
jgi:hypothetical protein